MADWKITLVNALTGNEVGEVSLPPDSTTQQLADAATAHLEGKFGCRYRLLKGDQELRPGAAKCQDEGFEDGSTLQAVASAEPAVCKKIGRTCVDIDEGYHCHDTFLQHVSSPDAGRFYFCWTRSFHGESYRDRDRRYQGPSHKELAITDVLSFEPAPQLTCTLHLADDTRHQRLDNTVLAIVDQLPIYTTAQPPEKPRDEGATATIEVQLSDGSRRVLWRAEDAGAFPAEFDGTGWRFTSAHFVGKGSIWLAKRKSGPDNGRADPDDVAIFAGEMDRDAHGQPQTVRFTRGAVQDIKHFTLDPSIKFYDTLRSAHLVGTDGPDPTVAFLYVLNCVLAVPLDTLQVRELTKTTEKYACLDPRTLDLYMLQDLSSHVYDKIGDEDSEACRIFRRRAVRGETAADVSYPNPFELVCKADLNIDGFSDSFCIGGVSYDAASDAIVILDAGSHVWSLPLKDARFQESRGDYVKLGRRYAD